MKQADTLYPNHLFRLRRCRSLSQKQLANLIGLKSSRVISELERGRRLPTLRIAALLEIVLGTKISEIYVDWYATLTEAVLLQDARLPRHDANLRNRIARKD